MELIIAMVVVSMGILPVLTLLIKTNRDLTAVELRMKRSFLGRDLISKVQAVRWDENTPASGAYITNRTTPANLGYTADGEANDIEQFDDVDDFDGFTDTSGIHTRTVSVTYANAPAGGTVTVSSTTATDFKLVLVTVNWTGTDPGSETQELVRANGD